MQELNSRLIAACGCVLAGALLGLPASASADALCSAPLAPAFGAQEDLASWIEKGRAQIESGDLAGARLTLEQAAAIEGRSGESTIWLLRLEIAEGKWNDVLGAASRMKREGQDSVDLTYVTGMAMAAKTRAEAAAGGGSVGFLLEDAKTALAEVLEADPARYRDAWIELARTAQMTGDSETSLKAARSVLEAKPEHAEALLLAGRAELALAALLYAEDPEAAKPGLERAKADLSSALELAGEDLPVAADAAAQLGTTAAYLGDEELKQSAYTRALALAPENGQTVQLVYNTLGNDPFAKAAEEALAAYTEREGEGAVGDATLRWWYGWALYSGAAGDEEQLKRAAEQYLAVLKKAPAFVDSHYYLGLIAYDSGRFEAAATSWLEFRRYMGTDAAGTFAGDELGAPRLEYVIGQVMAAGDLETAVGLGKLICEVQPENPVYWNNLGLFQRDLGDTRSATLASDDESGAAAIKELYENSYRAYTRALDLDPENPAYLNDTAVVLHYNLQRDLEQALAMYQAAERFAVILLEGDTLAEEERPVIEIALRDSRNNAKLLAKQLEKQPAE